MAEFWETAFTKMQMAWGLEPTVSASLSRNYFALPPCFRDCSQKAPSELDGRRDGTASLDMTVGVDFGAPQRTRDQRRKIIAVAAHLTGWHSHRIDATGMNGRLLASEPPGWTASELWTSPKQKMPS